MARALEYAHGQPGLALIHRDISPDNILRSMDGRVRLTDFGIAIFHLPDGDRGPRVEGYWLSRAGRGRFVDPEVIRRVAGRTPRFAGGLFTCPDTGLPFAEEIEANASQSLETSRIFSWRLGSTKSCTGADDAGLELCDVPFFNRFRFTNDDSGGLVGLFPVANGLRPVIGDGTVLAEGAAHPLPERLRSTWYNPETRQLFHQRALVPGAPDRIGVVRARR